MKNQFAKEEALFYEELLKKEINEDKGYYRIRCTQHLQEMLREGHDNGTLLLLDERRSKAARTIINGPLQATNPMKICFVYSEGRVSQ